MTHYHTKDKALEDLKNTALLYSEAKSYKNVKLEDIKVLLYSTSAYFKFICIENGYQEKNIRAIRKKLNDAGRRSAPWKAVSSIKPARPQDGKDGNRISRWLLPKDHKFYADEATAFAVEFKYYLQLLSTKSAPPIDKNIVNAFPWILTHPIEPGKYKDPIQLIDIDFKEIMQDASLIQSGHLLPLDRQGKHEPDNAFIMLARSNQLQGNLTVEELLQLLKDILNRHKLI